MEVAHPDPDCGGGKAQDDHVFVLRLWLERGTGEHTAALWRGRVKYLNRSEEVHVDGIEAALQAVRAALPRHPQA
jgi:hypothetical protein